MAKAGMEMRGKWKGVGGIEELNLGARGEKTRLESACPICELGEIPHVHLVYYYCGASKRGVGFNAS